MHDILLALLALAMMFSPCAVALFTFPMQEEDKEFVLDLVKQR